MVEDELVVQETDIEGRERPEILDSSGLCQIATHLILINYHNEPFLRFTASVELIGQVDEDNFGFFDQTDHK